MTADATTTVTDDVTEEATPQGLRGTKRSTWATVRRGLELSPELTDGLALTLVLAAVSTIGRVIVPIVVQQAMDHGILAEGGPDVARVWLLVAAAAVGVVITGVAAYALTVRLFRASEAGLRTLRVRGFRHAHDLSVLTQSQERRGSMVARVTSDVDTISQFVQFGGIILIVSLGQIAVATLLMLVYSPILTAVVWVCFVPLLLILRRFQRSLGRAYTAVRERVGDLLAAVSESVVGAATIRAHSVEPRTERRIDEAVEAHRHAAVRAHIRSSIAFSSGQFIAGFTLAVVLAVGTVLAAQGRVTLGELLAFLFLVGLFTQPVQQATEILNELQNAVAGWRRVIDIVDTPADVADPGPAGVVQPRGPITVTVEHATFAYPGGPPVLHDVSLEIPPARRIAVVGETGSGKSTLAKLVTRLMDPTSGRVLLDGVDLRRIRFSSLRERVVLVPQEGFLFDDTLASNIRFGAEGLSDEALLGAVSALGLDDWLASLPAGLDTPVGQRGESLSAGERQLLALIRAHLADPDLLVLDEATSAVDPATEVRIQRALEGLTRGRTSIAIAHRLSTAEAADEVVVVDAGRIVQRGPHRELVAQPGAYADLHASWVAHQGG
ncbi:MULTISPECIES: ABC transporter ATP-binding protein [unclassified Janibacter]|uniref:ABC transporter ATP-binding protein n=1 Tax=unclassified Janibacter TaxID=2649294 RepID=UPI003D029B80